MTIEQLRYYQSIAKAQLPELFARALANQDPEAEVKAEEAFKALQKRERLLAEEIRRLDTENLSSCAGNCRRVVTRQREIRI